VQPCEATTAGKGPAPAGFESSPRKTVGAPPVSTLSREGNETTSSARTATALTNKSAAEKPTRREDFA
jgi:hypothetical protein